MKIGFGQHKDVSYFSRKAPATARKSAMNTPAMMYRQSDNLGLHFS